MYTAPRNMRGVSVIGVCRMRHGRINEWEGKQHFIRRNKGLQTVMAQILQEPDHMNQKHRRIKKLIALLTFLKIFWISDNVLGNIFIYSFNFPSDMLKRASRGGF